MTAASVQAVPAPQAAVTPAVITPGAPVLPVQVPVAPDPQADATTHLALQALVLAAPVLLAVHLAPHPQVAATAPHPT